MRLLKKSGFFEKTKNPTTLKNSLFFVFVSLIYFWAQKILLHFISSNNKGFVSAKLFFLFVVFEDRYCTL